MGFEGNTTDNASEFTTTNTNQEQQQQEPPTSPEEDKKAKLRGYFTLVYVLSLFCCLGLLIAVPILGDSLAKATKLNNKLLPTECEVIGISIEESRCSKSCGKNCHTKKPCWRPNYSVTYYNDEEAKYVSSTVHGTYKWKVRDAEKQSSHYEIGEVYSCYYDKKDETNMRWKLAKEEPYRIAVAVLSPLLGLSCFACLFSWCYAIICNPKKQLNNNINNDSNNNDTTHNNHNEMKELEEGIHAKREEVALDVIEDKKETNTANTSETIDK